MNGTVTADLANMPLLNLVVLFVGLIALVVVTALVIKVFGLNISKDAIKTADYEYDQTCQTILYRLQEKIDDIDFETRSNIRTNTVKSNYKIIEIGNTKDLCQSARKNVFYILKEPFYDCINANHFTREFNATNYPVYRTNLITNVKSIYHDSQFENNLDKCKSNDMQEWDSVKTQIISLIDGWLYMAMHEVIKSCTLKIAEYKKTMGEVDKSKHWTKILKGCIDKNEQYIKNITELIEAANDSKR